MIEYALAFALACVALGILLNLARLAIGPSATDRILALDTMVINSISLLILYGVWQSSPMYFEAVLLLAMVGFISTVAYCRYILHGNVIE